MRRKVRAGGYSLGGITGYPLNRIYEEVAFIAYHFHWGLEEVMNLPHKERRKWCEEISEINRKLSEEMER
jgi:hypothetical protein